MELMRRSGRRRALSVLTWIVALSAALGWFAYLRPAGLGGSTGYVIISGESMEPVMYTGDLAIVRRSDEYRIGDVVAYRIPQGDVGGGMLVIHRVIGGNLNEGLILQGDNRETKDVWRPRTADVVGSVQWHVPHAGTGLFLLRTPLVLAGVLGFLGFWFVATSGSSDDKADEEPSDDATEDLPPENVPTAPAPVTAPVEIVLPDAPVKQGSDVVTVAVTASVLALSVAAARHRR